MKDQASLHHMVATPSTAGSRHISGCLTHQTVVVIGGTAGIGLATAKQAQAQGADVMITGRDPDRLRRAADELNPHRDAAFDATDPVALKRFFDGIEHPLDHVLVTAGRPRYGRLLTMDRETLREAISAQMLMAIDVARQIAGKLRPGGSLLLMGGTGARRISRETGIMSAVTLALPGLTASLAIELAPARVNLIAAGFVDTSLSAELLGDRLDARREELRATLPVRRVVEPDDVAALAIHLMANTAITGATLDIDGGQQFVGSER